MEVIKYSPYMIIENSANKSFVFVINDNSIFEIDNKTSEILQLEGKTPVEAYKSVAGCMEKDEFDNLYNSMKEAHFIVTQKEKKCEEIVTQREKGELKGLTLMIIQECNLRCTYCYGNGGEYQDKGKMPAIVAKKSIDYLLKNSTEHELLVCFLGGEPLMNFPLIQEVVSYCIACEKDSNRHFKYTITTNGTIWNEDIENFFKKYKFTVQISVDGAKDVHNHNRFYANGTGSFEIMEKNTARMRMQGLISGRATITGTNLNVVENFQALDQMNFKSIPMVPAQNLLSDKEYEQLINENKHLVKYFAQLIKEKKYKTAKKMRMFMSGLYKIHKSGTIRDVPCGVGSNQIAIDINGDIYPCHRFVANKEYSMGNVLQTMEYDCQEFLEEISVKNHQQCEKCWAKNLCVGACPNENLVNMGTTKISSIRNCDYIRSMYRDLLNVYIDLSLEDKKTLFG